MRVLDLFSGIGGFSLGLERSGPFRTAAFCEREPFPQAVLRKHWPDVPIYDDVRTIPTDELGTIDVICGGFPCQPWSVAGQQRGAEDDRDLWPVMASLIEKLRPRWVIGENVRGFVNEPLGLQRSLSDLESLGYQTAPFIVPACAVDAPHRRDRVWIVAHAAQFHRDGGEHYGENDTPRWVQGQLGGSCSADDVAHTNDTRPQGRTETGSTGSQRTWRDEHSQRCCDDQGPARRTEPGMGLLVDGVSRWMDEPDIGRVATGVKNQAARLKALGNAVVPQVVEQIGRAIMDAENAS
jgi:DNA (cytosine-5)-methyltransferase 1